MYYSNLIFHFLFSKVNETSLQMHCHIVLESIYNMTVLEDMNHNAQLTN